MRIRNRNKRWTEVERGKMEQEDVVKDGKTDGAED
jgi:hypothetical protein